MKVTALALLMIPGLVSAQSIAVPWNGYGHDAQHTALSANASQSLNRVHWSTPVDTSNPSSGGTSDILVHYGSPMVTAANTVLVPLTTLNGSSYVYQVEAFAAGSLLYTLTSDYSVPAHNWRPSFSPTLSLRNRMYYPGAGGTVYYRDNVDSATGPSGQIAFYGNSIYQANPSTFATSVQISTPLVFDRYGDIFFGFVVVGPTPGVALSSGVARISTTGVGSWVSAQSTSGGDSYITHVPLNCTPALSNDHRTLYFAITYGGVGSNTDGGYLVSVDATTLAPINHASLIDPSTSEPAGLYSDGSASPTVGPDGDVYYGVLETTCCQHNDRGWLLHFDSTLTHVKTPGSFGWDTTAAVVPRSLVPSYSGSSSYLVLTKYNNYNGVGNGNGVNKVAVLDPNAPMSDPIIPSVTVMREVLTIVGVGTPPVSEWCINSAAIDPYTKSAIINSEDGHVYRWDFTSNTLIQSVYLNQPIGEAYTPTAIGPDGTIYAINDAILYALGN